MFPALGSGFGLLLVAQRPLNPRFFLLQFWRSSKHLPHSLVEIPTTSNQKSYSNKATTNKDLRKCNIYPYIIISHQYDGHDIYIFSYLNHIIYFLIANSTAGPALCSVACISPKYMELSAQRNSSHSLVKRISKCNCHGLGSQK